MKTTINTNVTLTPMERKALAITGRPIEEILLLYRYRAIVPHTEREHHFIHTVHHYVDLDYKVPKDKCVQIGNTIYCENAYYAMIRA